ncbi:TetR/AcrR family transcriptional regulator C-terminal domain-containing protein [Rhodococcus sp. NPDC059968]|uniref:TetR/AcrR family transcriptional regulator C-terminal domain-containing protein n=1 Tax=Rhodococcus sp. NPDC059968 TaxID=3347017 RepID=UPI00366B4A37
MADSPKTLSVGALSTMERLMRTLREAGVRAADRMVAADTLLSHITGFVLQKQSESRAPTIGAEDVARLRERFPMTLADGHVHDQDEKFARSVHLLCAAIDTRIERGNPV